MPTPTESINGLTSVKVLGYFESVKSNFYLKLGSILWLEAGCVDWHKALSDGASAIAGQLGDQLAEQILGSIGSEPVENLKEDAVTALIVSAWSVFEQIIKDLTVPDYATYIGKLNADYHNGILGLEKADRDQIDLFYHIRNAIAHYNGAYHAYKPIDLTYQGTHFKSNGHFGEKIIISPQLAVQITDDLQRYAMKAWTHCGRS